MLQAIRPRRDMAHPEWYDLEQSRVVFHVRGNTVNGKTAVRDLSQYRHAISAPDIFIGQALPYVGDYFSSLGTTGRIAASLASDQRLTNTDFDVDVIFRSTQITGVRMVFGISNGGINTPANNQLLLYLNANALEAVAYQGASSPTMIITSATGIANGAWRVARFGRRNTAFRLQIDGVTAGTGALTGALNDMGSLELFGRTTSFALAGDIHACRVTTGSTRPVGDYIPRQTDWPIGYPPVLAA